MKTKYIITLVLSVFLLSGCSNGKELFLQSVQSTAPKEQINDIGQSFAPTNETNIDPYGTIITTKNNMALYTNLKDSINQSNCYDECAIAWPPFTVKFEEDVGGKYGVIQRKDGTLQVTYNGQPLYTYTPDSPNKVTGDGKNNQWSVVLAD